jgi:hypothetical protein
MGVRKGCVNPLEKPTYSITRGADLFETAETRKLKRLTWVPVPNKHDGKGYRRILRLQEGPLVYAAWLLILQVASKCPTRWILSDSDGPMDASDLSDKTGFPVEYFAAAFKHLTSREIGWLTCDGEQIPSPAIPADPPAVLGDHPERREGKGTEGKGREMSGASPRVNEPWTAAAGDAWIARFGGTAPFGRIGKALKPLVDKHGWDREVKGAWGRYLADENPTYASPEGFSQKFSMYKLQGRISDCTRPEGFDLEKAAAESRKKYPNGIVPGVRAKL